MPEQPEVEGWVIAGGESRRMGRDKATLAIGGEPLLAQMIGKMRSLGLPVRIAGLRVATPTLDAEVMADRFAGCGPLGGLETALRESRAACVLALAVDLPLLASSFLRLLLDRAARTGALATIPRVGGAPQPLCAVYHRDLHAGVAEALGAGDYKIMRVIERVACAAGGVEDLDIFNAETLWTAAGVGASGLPIGLQFLNCNTPADQEMTEALLAGARQG